MEDVICVLWPDTLIVPYGSYASGMMTADSDVDMVVSLNSLSKVVPAMLYCLSIPYSMSFSLEGETSLLWQRFLQMKRKMTLLPHSGVGDCFVVSVTSKCKAGGLLHLLVVQGCLCLLWPTIVPRCLLWAIRCSPGTSESARQQAHTPR